MMSPALMTLLMMFGTILSMFVLFAVFTLLGWP